MQTIFIWWWWGHHLHSPGFCKGSSCTRVWKSLFSLYVGKMPGGYGSRFAPSQSGSHKILLVSTALSLSLAIFAFTLQWRGGDLVETARLGDASGDAQRLPGVQFDSNSLTPLGGRTGTPISDCSKNRLPKVGLFPHHPGWQYALGNGTTSKVIVCWNPSLCCFDQAQFRPGIVASVASGSLLFVCLFVREFPLKVCIETLFLLVHRNHMLFCFNWVCPLIQLCYLFPPLVHFANSFKGVHWILNLFVHQNPYLFCFDSQFPPGIEHLWHWFVCLWVSSILCI